MEECPEVKEGEIAGTRVSEENTDSVDEDGWWTKGRTKRKRQRQKFEMFKRFCERVVETLMVQQEEMHNRLLEDLMKRDEEMVAREEEWKKQEMDRINKELDIRANEQAMAGDRQATMIEVLKKFTTSISEHKILSSGGDGHVLRIPSNTCSESSWVQPANTDSSDLNRNGKNAVHAGFTDTESHQTTENSAPGSKNLNPNFPSSHNKNPKSPAAGHEIGSRRWPRDEVQALINLRCSINGDHHRKKPDHHPKGGSHEFPLWERIAQGMQELGYKRSAKRCKEKWENINKYFRKTKDANRKRPADSRTCPYFHQLSSLYGQAGNAGSPSPPGKLLLADQAVGGEAEGEEGV